HQVDARVDGERADQVRQEDHAAAQHADQHQVLSLIVGRDALAELYDLPLDRVGGNEDAFDLRVHGDARYGIRDTGWGSVFRCSDVQAFRSGRGAYTAPSPS